MTRNRMLAAAGVVAVVVGVFAAAALTADEWLKNDDPAAAAHSTPIPQATKAELAAAGLDLTLAPSAKRVDLVAPPFSNPTKVTNPLFPIANLPSAILSGTVDGKPFKTETTLLPETRIVEWRGGRIEALVSQYVAYLDGRIEEVALDFYAQADDGSVWYLGEDVFNYADGSIADTAGTWLAGRDGPPALIMPAEPNVGDVFRPENVPGLVFEEVTIKTVDKTVTGPSGLIEGAVVASELHQDGSREDKVFAPGYGEFFTGSGGDVEAMSLAVPADALEGPPPVALSALSARAAAVFDHAAAGNWSAASSDIEAIRKAWSGLRAGEVPPRLEARLDRALRQLTRAVTARNPGLARHAAVAVGQNSMDLQLRHRPPAEIDRARFALWARQLVVDASAGDATGVRGDVATLEWIRDRFAHTLDRVGVARLDENLVELRSMVADDDLRGAAVEAARLLRKE